MPYDELVFHRKYTGPLVEPGRLIDRNPSGVVNISLFEPLFCEAPRRHSAQVSFFQAFSIFRGSMEFSMSLVCSRCGYSTLRPSRLRSSDILHLLLLTLPVRCKTCRERYFVSLPFFRKIRDTGQSWKSA
jgi:DNA-directed RNA polymerase subunit RPC12/RpoP